MRICLIGKNLTNFVLAKILTSKKLSVEIIHQKRKEKNFSKRTLAISKDNFNFLLNTNKKMKITAWPVKNIKIYNNQNDSKELFEFKKENKENFFLIKYSNIFKSFENSCKKNKKIKFKVFKDYSKINYLHEKNNYDIIINSDVNINFNNKYLNKRIEKNYNSFAYTGIINHKKKIMLQFKFLLNMDH